jgi:hypothetical protein
MSHAMGIKKKSNNKIYCNLEGESQSQDFEFENILLSRQEIILQIWENMIHIHIRYIFCKQRIKLLVSN